MTDIGKSLICTITLILLNRRHSQLVKGSWMRRGAIVKMAIVCFDNPKSFISLSTSALCLILIVDRTSRSGVIVRTFLCHIVVIKSIRSVSRLSVNLIWLFVAHYSEGFNTWDELRPWRHVSVRAGPRHMRNSRYSWRDLRLFGILLRHIHFSRVHQRIRTFADFPSFLLLGVPVYNYLVVNKDWWRCLRIYNLTII